MSDMFRCDDKEALVAYLYGESDAALTREIERHLHLCTPCSEEVASLQGVRRELETWVPPMPDLGFTIVRQPAPQPAAVLRPARWATLRSLPAWAQAAAAVLVIGVGAAIANVQVRYGNDGVQVTTGWLSPTPSPAVTPNRDEWRPALIALEQTLRTEMAQMKRTPDASAINARAAEAVDSAAIMRRVQSMLETSERRQREDASLMLTQFTRDVELQRRADLMRINQTFGALQGRTFKNEAGQAEMMNLLRRVSVQPVP
jgi:hypothetical protein